ncbi:MAG: DUF1565 domain-containing protein, partial [Phycisphaerales bacterium]
MYRIITHLGYLAWFSAFCLPASGKTIYVNVDARGNNSGASWGDAYPSFSNAIDRASPGDEVWVAKGTYGPISLKSGVKVIGGFAGTETEASASDPDAHKTYITGSRKTRAVESIGNNSSTVLRGFYITKGFIASPETGGGMYLEKSDALFLRCVFTGNKSAIMGGAVAVWGGAPHFVNCRFYDNDGGWAAGAVFVRRSATPTFVNCLFCKNTAGEGGAVSIVTGAPTFINCTISGNKAGVSKGGALFDSQESAILRNCILWGNTSPVTGANEIYNAPSGARTTTVTHSAVKGGWPGEGNLNSDPLFVDPATGDYRIRQTSP